MFVGYRPPNAPVESLDAMLDFFSRYICCLNDDSYDLMVTGDFNIPVIDWETISVCPGGSAEMQQSARSLLTFMSKHLLSQYVMCPTRGSNILDLFLTNNDRLITNVKSESSSMSCLLYTSPSPRD